MRKAGEGQKLAGRRVLIVEDELLVAMDMEQLLRRHGGLVLGPAPSVARALALIDERLPDVAVLDVQLGAERAAPIAERLAADGVPFVLVTGHGGIEPEEPALRSAPRLNKPVVEQQLVRAIAGVLGAAG